MFRIFYDKRTLGDVMFILIDPEAKVDATKTEGQVTALFHEGKIVGYNVFDVSSTMKLPSKGAIFAPSDELLKVVNALLSLSGFASLPTPTSSMFKVMKILSLEEHPLDEKAKIVELGVQNERFSAVSSLNGLQVGMKVVVALDGCILHDGSLFHQGPRRNIPCDVQIMSGPELLLNDEKGSAFEASNAQEGEDFFYAA